MRWTGRYSGSSAVGHEDDEQVADDLDAHVAGHEQPRPGAEGVGDRDCADHAGEHPDQEDPAHHQRARVEPVRGPHRVDPRPPGGEDQQPGLRRAAEGQVVREPARQLRDDEDEDEVEEQLDRGRTRLAIRRPADRLHRFCGRAPPARRNRFSVVRAAPPPRGPARSSGG